MLAHKLRMIASIAAIAMGLATVASTHADEASRTQYLTFTRPVALPGVTLKSGTYIFELADPDAAPDVVRVLSRDRKTVFLTAFTSVDRSARQRPAQSVRVARARSHRISRRPSPCGGRIRGRDGSSSTDRVES